ncbi:Oligoribonuclease NrnB or cAMP/cGMP phosphodiesterase, DHH superfamily [Desulforamulus putei DSM 12395]|uniref:Oligoribonuclease NrnB or cAMP/cGMP phosphodiesterase, DHH superfamily n=1 Tax=Desulforamulus putei DSM 12395 TaxID=1121429 RepID=A0A1M4ZCS5_9FIRM|nr:DHHA1 domain-containing protein [Desulforamulus putei]SHF15765.1 Oligoribonuclease NrnB or cAMP/cGMP phosphodiesterase, DHH superfamily [Desulforamulus putei DSM 12395]
MKKILVTHNDMDGCACAVVFKTAFPDSVIFYEDYKTVNQKVMDLLVSEPELLYLADISVNKEVARELDKANSAGMKVRLFDHHATALWMQKYPWCVIDTSLCGACIMFKELEWDNNANLLFEFLNFELSRLVHIVNTYDMWLWTQNPESPESKMAVALNDLLSATSREYWVNKFMHNPVPQLTDYEKTVVDAVQVKRMEYIRKTNVDIFEGPVKFGVCYAEQYTSELGYYKNQEMDIDFLVIVNVRDRKLSFRSKEFNVAQLAKLAGGGGHPQSAGCSLPEGKVEDFIKSLLQKL